MYEHDEMEYFPKFPYAFLHYCLTHNNAYNAQCPMIFKCIYTKCAINIFTLTNISHTFTHTIVTKIRTDQYTYMYNVHIVISAV